MSTMKIECTITRLALIGMRLGDSDCNPARSGLMGRGIGILANDPVWFLSAAADTGRREYRWRPVEACELHHFLPGSAARADCRTGLPRMIHAS